MTTWDLLSSGTTPPETPRYYCVRIPDRTSQTARVVRVHTTDLGRHPLTSRRSVRRGERFPMRAREAPVVGPEVLRTLPSRPRSSVALGIRGRSSSRGQYGNTPVSTEQRRSLCRARFCLPGHPDPRVTTVCGSVLVTDRGRSPVPVLTGHRVLWMKFR